MRKLEDAVTTDDLVNSLLVSVATDPQSPSSPSVSSATTPAVARAPPATPSGSEIKPSIGDDDISSPLSTPTPTLSPPLTSLDGTTSETTSSKADTTTSNTNTNSDVHTKSNTDPNQDTTSSSKGSKGSTSGAALSVGIAVGILILVVAVLLFLRSRRRRRSAKSRPSLNPVVAGVPALAVPSDRGFQKERDLGLPEMSIELSPGTLTRSKGFDVSYASSTRSSGFQPSASVASSSSSSVFNTKGGVSPSTLHGRKGASSFSYQYRDSENNDDDDDDDGRRPVAPSLAASTTFHLTGLIGTGQTSREGGRGGALHLSRTASKAGRKLSAPDEYAELVTATNASGTLDQDEEMLETGNGVQGMLADFTQSGSSQNESLGPDSPLAKTGRRPGLVPAVLRQQQFPQLQQQQQYREGEVQGNDMSTVSFLSESSLSSTSTSDSLTTSLHASAYESPMPLLQQLSSADESDYGEELGVDRGSVASSEEAKMARSGSLIAFKLEADSGSREIAI